MAGEKSEKFTNLFIKDLLEQVHEELIDSQTERQQKAYPPIFEVEKLTIEAHFIVTDKDTEEGGLDIKILKAGVQSITDQQQVHKITLHLKAIESKGKNGFSGLESNNGSFRPREE